MTLLFCYCYSLSVVWPFLQYIHTFNLFRRAQTQMRFPFRQFPLSPAPNRPYLPQPLAQTSKSDEVTIPRLLKRLHLKCNLINSWSHLSPASECLLRTWLNTWRSVCWIHAGENSEIECYRRRKNKSKCLLKVRFSGSLLSYVAKGTMIRVLRAITVSTEKSVWLVFFKTSDGYRFN